MSSRFIHVTYGRVSFFKVELYSVVCIHNIVFIQLLMDTFSSISWLIVNNAAMKMEVQIFLQDPNFTSFGYSKVGLYMVDLFLILWELPTIFCTECTILYSHQQCICVPIAPHLRHCISFYYFLETAILTGVR